MSTERIWYDDLHGFINNQNYYIILPSQYMTIEEKLNATFRFFLYLGVILAILKQNYKYLFFGIIAALLSVLLYQHEQNSRRWAENFLQKQDLDIVDNQVCVRSTIDNPFMNPTVVDIEENPDRPPACSLENDRVQHVVEDNFEARLFRDVSDLYGNQSSQRQFYTLPNTMIPNDQTGFAKWCFGTGASCKDGNGDQCVQNMMDDVQRRPGQNSTSS